MQAVDTIGITISDMERAIVFYTNILSFRKISDIKVKGKSYDQLLGLSGVALRLVRLQLGNEVIELIEHLNHQGKPIPPDSRSNDLWFQHIAIVVTDMDRAYQKLQEFDVTAVSTAPQKLPDYIEGAAGVKAFYFCDPDGNILELICFPPDKGDSRWHIPTEQLFLGIDHTAIAISDTETSRQFYQDLLGLEVTRSSEHYGQEQENINNVEDARIRITGLKANQGMEVEFLQYLQPDNARPFPEDASPQDLIHWETTYVVQDVNLVAEKLRQGGCQFVSDQVVEITEATLGFKLAFLVRDPDGHVLRIVQR